MSDIEANALSSPPPDDDILSYLGSRPQSMASATRKEIRRHLKFCAKEEGSASSKPSKTNIKRALRRLARRGAVAREGKTYRLATNTKGERSLEIDGDVTRKSVKEAGPLVPIGMRMRQGRRRPSAARVDYCPTGGGMGNPADLDEEIRRLEAELAADDDESEGSDSHVDEIEPLGKTISFGEISVHEYNAGAPQETGDFMGTEVICLSDVAGERIKPLPRRSLPQNKRRTLKGVDSARGVERELKKGNKKRKRETSEEERRQNRIGEGLRDAVRDLLENYVPSSKLDRPPLYCRVCRHQSKSQAEFNAHRATELHAAAVKEERRRTYCSLCRKQLTSVVQMEEHLRSRPHRDRMDYVKGKQRGAMNGGGSGRGRGRGQGGVGRGGKREARQWC